MQSDVEWLKQIRLLKTENKTVEVLSVNISDRDSLNKMNSFRIR